MTTDERLANATEIEALYEALPRAAMSGDPAKYARRRPSTRSTSMCYGAGRTAASASRFTCGTATKPTRASGSEGGRRDVPVQPCNSETDRRQRITARLLLGVWDSAALRSGRKAWKADALPTELPPRGAESTDSVCFWEGGHKRPDRGRTALGERITGPQRLPDRPARISSPAEPPAPRTAAA